MLGPGRRRLPAEQHLPGPAREALLRTIAPDTVIGRDGTEHALTPVTKHRPPPLTGGDALVVATSGATARPRG